MLALRAVGLTATTNAGGAGKWWDEYAQQLRAAGVEAVVAIPDNDDAGRQHAEIVARSCHAVGLRAKVVTLPDLPPKGDVSDYLTTRSRADLIALVKQTPLYEPALEIEPEPAASAPATLAESPGTVEPSTPIDLATLLDEVETFIRRYVVLTGEQAVAVTLWTAHTHAIDAADCTPYLSIRSATKRTGKTRLLEVLEPLVREPWLTGRTTAAALARKVDAIHPTLLLDESDAAFGGEPEYAEALRGLLNTGHRRSGKATVCTTGGAAVIDFSTFCPKALAGIGRLPDTIADRSIPILLRRRRKDEAIARWRDRDGTAAARPLRDRLAACAARAVEGLRKARPALPDALDDRAQDVWEPLLAICDAAGDAWPERARRAAVALMSSRESGDDSISVQLLADIREIFAEAGDPDALPSKDIRDKLCALENRPWAEWGRAKKPITGHGVAKLLRDFGIAPGGHMRFGDRVAAGYRRAPFGDAWERYLPPPDGPETLLGNEANKDGPQPEILFRNETDSVTNARTLVSLDKHGLSYDVTNEKPPERSGAEFEGTEPGQGDLWVEL